MEERGKKQRRERGEAVKGMEVAFRDSGLQLDMQ